MKKVIEKVLFLLYNKKLLEKIRTSFPRLRRIPGFRRGEAFDKFLHPFYKKTCAKMHFSSRNPGNFVEFL